MKWKPVADGLRRQIADGTLKPGDRPSIWSIRRESGLSKPTIARALRALADEGLLVRYGGLGYTVAEPPPEWVKDRSLSRDEVAAMFQVNPKTVTRWGTAGKLASFRAADGNRYRASEVEELLRGGP